jgi:protein O-mannosyl-transferase
VKKNETHKSKINIIILASICGILLFTGLLYRGSLKGEFLSYDDTDNIVNNPVIRQLSFESLPRFFSSGKLYMFTPVTFISYALDYKMHGFDPFYFRLTNLLLHLLNIILVLLLSAQLLKKLHPALLLDFLFAVHPANVDSVAWISGRSNLLSALFFLLTLISYMKYVQQNKPVFLLISVVTFIFSLLSKSSGVMLPFTLLLIDFLQHRKLSPRVVLEKIPFLVISLAAGLLTIWFRADTGATQNITAYTLTDRFFITCYSLLVYLFRSVIPLFLSEVYAYPVIKNGFLPFLYYLSPFIIGGIVVFLYNISLFKRAIIFGSCFFLFNIIITQLTLLEDGYTANRYAYLPLIGIFFILTTIYDHFSSHTGKMKNYVSVITLIVLLGFSCISWQRSQVWMNAITLFDHAVSRSPDAAFAYNNRGIAKYTRDPESSIADYDQAIKLNPAYSGAYYNRGIAYNAVGEYKKAWDDYTRAVELNPGFASSYAARGILEMDVLQDDSLALQDYNSAIRINPAFGMAYFNRGILYLRMNDVSSACKDFQKVRSLGFSNADEIITRYCN